MKISGLTALLLAGALCFSSTGCKKSDDGGGTLKPAGSAPAWGPGIHNEMLVVIEKLISYNQPPIETVTPAEARRQPTIADAVRDVMADHNIAMPAATVDTSGVEIPVDGGTGNIHARIYKPKNAAANLPVIVFFHGGGWVIANIDVYNASAQALSEKTGAMVVSVGYRKGPEYRFPTAHNDCFTAYKWTLKNISKNGGNPAKVAVAGESAGGNLACNVSIMARDSSVQMPVHQLLIYPVASNYTFSESYMKYKDAKPLNKAMVYWFLSYFLPDMSFAGDARISLVNANLSRLPPTTIINAEIDPLRDDGAALANKLQSSGVKVTRRLYDGVTHEFFGTATVVPEARDAQDYSAAELKKSF